MSNSDGNMFVNWFLWFGHLFETTKVDAGRNAIQQFGRIFSWALVQTRLVTKTMSDDRLFIGCKVLGSYVHTAHIVQCVHILNIVHLVWTVHMGHTAHASTCCTYCTYCTNSTYCKYCIVHTVHTVQYVHSVHAALTAHTYVRTLIYIYNIYFVFYE